MTDDFVLPPMLPDPDKGRDVLCEVADALVERFGFSEMEPGVYMFEVDAQHSAKVLVSPWNGRRRNLARVQQAVIRRDVNDLRRELLQPDLPVWASSISNSRPRPHFFGEDDPRFDYKFHTPEFVQERLDEAIPRLLSEACTFEFFSDYLLKCWNDPKNRQTSQAQMFMTALLDGWSEEAEQEFLAPMVRSLDKDWDDESKKAWQQGRVDRVRAWIAEHPDGVERELTG